MGVRGGGRGRSGRNDAHQSEAKISEQHHHIILAWAMAIVKATSWRGKRAAR
jgi:hypothetical protein